MNELHIGLFIFVTFVLLLMSCISVERAIYVYKHIQNENKTRLEFLIRSFV